MPLTALIIQILVLAVPIGIYSTNKNWAYLIVMFGVQLLIMPFILIVSGITGLICSILALKKICFKIRYVVMIVLSSAETILAIQLFRAMFYYFMH